MRYQMNHLYCDKFLIGVWKIDKEKSIPIKEIETDEATKLIKSLEERDANHYDRLGVSYYEVSLPNHNIEQHIFYRFL